jgi:hypothetical protein
MKKTYSQPQTTTIEVRLFGSVLSDEKTGIGISSKYADDSIVFSKGNNFEDMEDIREDPWETEAPNQFSNKGNEVFPK